MYKIVFFSEGVKAWVGDVGTDREFMEVDGLPFVVSESSMYKIVENVRIQK